MTDEYRKQFVRFTGLLAGVTYKPGWSLDAELNYDVVELRVSRVASDAQDPSRTTAVYGERHISARHLAGMEDDLVLRWLYEQVTRAEIHEVNEWFKVDGRHFVDPHPENKEKK